MSICNKNREYLKKSNYIVLDFDVDVDVDVVYLREIMNVNLENFNNCRLETFYYNYYSRYYYVY